MKIQARHARKRIQFLYQPGNVSRRGSHVQYSERPVLGRRHSHQAANNGMSAKTLIDSNQISQIQACLDRVGMVKQLRLNLAFWEHPALNQTFLQTSNTSTPIISCYYRN